MHACSSLSCCVRAAPCITVDVHAWYEHMQPTMPPALSCYLQGLAALLVQGLSGCTPAEILAVDAGFIELLGLKQSLTPSRNNGFLNMFKLMQKKSLQVMAAQAQEAGQQVGLQHLATCVLPGSKCLLKTICCVKLRGLTAHIEQLAGPPQHTDGCATSPVHPCTACRSHPLLLRLLLPPRPQRLRLRLPAQAAPPLQTPYTPS